MKVLDTSRVVRVLLVYGDGPEREQLVGGLAREGLRVLTAGTADEALRRYRAEAPDAAVLDAGAAAFDALALCRGIRERTGPNGTPVLLLGGGLDDAQAIQVYAAGADAYVPLPCSPVVLAARLRALVGTAAAGAAAAGAAYGHRPEGVLRLGGWEVDPQTQEARPLSVPGAEPLALTRAECRLLYLLAANAGRTVSAERLGEYAGVARVRSHVSRARRKLGLPPSGAGAIEAHEGLGYRYVPPVAA